MRSWRALCSGFYLAFCFLACSALAPSWFYDALKFAQWYLPGVDCIGLVAIG